VLFGDAAAASQMTQSAPAAPSASESPPPSAPPAAADSPPPPVAVHLAAAHLPLTNLHRFVNAVTPRFEARSGGGDDDTDGGSKTFLLLESGTRFHTTTLLRDKGATPSNIALKMRLHLRTRRLVDVRQLGADRVVVFTFGALCVSCVSDRAAVRSVH
jgi:hypothetical protein